MTTKTDSLPAPHIRHLPHPGCAVQCVLTLHSHSEAVCSAQCGLKCTVQCSVHSIACSAQCSVHCNTLQCSPYKVSEETKINEKDSSVFLHRFITEVPTLITCPRVGFRVKFVGHPDGLELMV